MTRKLPLAAAFARVAPCLCALALLCAVARPALAAEVRAVGDAAVVVPWGDWIVAGGGLASSILVPVLALAATWAIHAYVPLVGSFVSQALVERLVQNAAGYAQNAVAGAAKGRTLDVPTGSAVIAKAAQRAVDQAPAWLLREAGGPAGVAEKVFRALHLDETATAANTLAPALQALPPRG